MDKHRRAIEAAIVAGDVEGLRHALGDAADFPDTRDECGVPYLDYAIYRGPPALVRALLDLGADPCCSDDGGVLSLFAAVDRASLDRHDVLVMLLAAGASTEQRGSNDYTALHYAACRNDTLAVELLLRHGADPDARTRIDHYATPLEECETFGHAAGAAALRRWTEQRNRPRRAPWRC